MTRVRSDETEGAASGVLGPYLFDTNVIDEVLDDLELCELFVRASAELGVKFYVTHIAIDEVEKIPIARDELRQALLQVIAQVPTVRIATSTFVLGISRLGEARLGSDAEAEDFDRLTGGNDRHAEDAMLALTARSIGAIVVSEDKDLRKRAGRLAITCLTTGQLQEILTSRLL